VPQLKQLLQSLNESIRLNPLEADFYAYRAKIYRRMFEKTQKQSDLQEAILNYQTAIQHSPYNVFMRAEYAYLLTSIGRYDAAALELSRVIEMEPAYLSARYLLAETRFRSGDIVQARKDLEQADQFSEKFKNYRAPAGDHYTIGLLMIRPETQEQTRRLIIDAR
jgi:tetratricopeptide (TPR) repeat protein